MSHNDTLDDYDYGMSDLFISETRGVSYRLGFKSRPVHNFRILTLAEINRLPEKEFLRFIRDHAGRPPQVEGPPPAIVDRQRREIADLRSRIERLERMLSAPKGEREGLRVGIRH